MREKVPEYQAIILAGLLHDIGKFYQRAGYELELGQPGDAYDFGAFTKRDGLKTTHIHGAFTAKFFREYLSQYDEVGVLAALHHVPENANNDRQKFLAKIIALADRLSSGERQERADDEESGKPYEEPLTSIFSQINLVTKKTEEKWEKNNSGGSNDFFVPLSILDRDLNNLFPVTSKKEAFGNLAPQEAYKNLWDNFVQDLDRLYKKLEISEIMSQIYYLLLKYTTSMPAAAYREKPDISLFHHLKTTAALAACLYQLSQEQDEFASKIDQILSEIRWQKQSEKKERSFLENEDFLLVGGDISGIQDFIYQVTSEKALKGLRARSFYLQLISEIVARKILNEFDLPETNLLYCGGGNFYLLLPRLKETEHKLKLMQREIDEVLLKVHKGKVATILSWVPISYEKFFLDFASLWEELGGRLSREKRRKFSSLMNTQNPEKFIQQIMGPFDIGGEKKGCPVCGEEIEWTEDICKFCDSLIDLSKYLINAEAIALRVDQKRPLPEKDFCWYHVPQALGFNCELISYGDDPRRYRGSLVINSVDFAGKYQGFTFIARRTQAADGRVMTLEDMAAAAKGIRKWGVIRADVDHLGKLFRVGLGENKTISRVSMLSSMLSLYFSARITRLESWVGRYCNKDASADDIYIAYSGGDDLFLIGPWSELLAVAGAIYEDFRKFSCGQLTLSAGIFFAPRSKYPIYQAARMAGEAEDKAKDEGRDRLTIFGESIKWTQLTKVEEIIDLVAGLLTDEEGKEVPRSLLNVLYNIYQEKEMKKNNEIPMERVWRLHYALKKLMAKVEDKKKYKLNRIIELIIADYEIYPYLNIATRVADFLTRKEKEVR